jgi:hypothetical protein
MTKLTLHKVAIQTPIDENIERYRHYRNVYNSLVRTSRRWYFDDGLKKAKKDPKKTWNLINEALNRSSGNEKIEKLQVDGNIITEQKEILNTFNEFFINAGKNISNSVPPLQTKNLRIFCPMSMPRTSFLAKPAKQRLLLSLEHVSPN